MCVCVCVCVCKAHDTESSTIQPRLVISIFAPWAQLSHVIGQLARRLAPFPWRDLWGLGMFGLGRIPSKEDGRLGTCGLGAWALGQALHRGRGHPGIDPLSVMNNLVPVISVPDPRDQSPVISVAVMAGTIRTSTPRLPSSTRRSRRQRLYSHSLPACALLHHSHRIYPPGRAHMPTHPSLPSAISSRSTSPSRMPAHTVAHGFASGGSAKVCRAGCCAGCTGKGCSSRIESTSQSLI